VVFRDGSSGALAAPVVSAVAAARVGVMAVEVIVVLSELECARSFGTMNQPDLWHWRS
jgi:hypothetical protein